MGILYPNHPAEKGHPLDTYCVALSAEGSRNSVGQLGWDSFVQDSSRRKPSSPNESYPRNIQLQDDAGSLTQSQHVRSKASLPIENTSEKHSQSSERHQRRRRLSARDRTTHDSDRSHGRPRRGSNDLPSNQDRLIGQNQRMTTQHESRQDTSELSYQIPRGASPARSERQSAVSEHPRRGNGRADGDSVFITKPETCKLNRQHSSLPGADFSLPTTQKHAPNPRAYQSSRHSSRQNSNADESSVWDEVEFYKYGRMPDDGDRMERRCCMSWSRRRKWAVFGALTATILLVVILAVAIPLSREPYTYTASTAKVTNSEAFSTGGASNRSSNDVQDGTGSGKDAYTYYSGDASNFPPSTTWVSFEDMWAANLNSMQNSCSWLDEGSDDSSSVIANIYSAIQDRANASLVDHRFILATVLQESSGCVHAGQTTSSGGVTNPGLMQSHDGHTYDASHSNLSILWMIQDGTQGTQTGDGLVQYLNKYGNPYEAARGYNSGYLPVDGNLSAAAGATACYVSDIANRLTGWVTAKSTCPGDTA